MGKKNKALPNLGRALIKDRFGSNRGRKFVENNSMLHTTEIQDGYDWGRLNLQSVTEESSFQEFLSTAELASREFQGEKLNITFVNPRVNVGLLTSDETKKIKAEHEQNKEFIKIPRRPPWNSQTTREELDRLEREHFLEWRRDLSTLQENQGLLLTPFEKNLEFWRQLWRVVERSDVIVQIVDARNPLLFRCEDLEQYVKEVSKNKINMILINKADFLTEEQRKIWADYFTEKGVRVAFFSALLSSEELDEIKEDSDEEKESEKDSDEESDVSEIQESINKLEEAVEKSAEKLEKIQEKLDSVLKSASLGESSVTPESTEDSNKTALETPEISNKTASEKSELCTEKDKASKENSENSRNTEKFNSSELLTREKLIDLFRTIHEGPKVTENVTTIGLVGYPNVGKSSTINSLMTAKKVSVSATPGKTKHFQTLYLDKDILLCDCPGLVMPSFVFTKAEMVINGILPIDQMRDHVPPVNLVANLIPRHVIEDKYGIMLPKPEDGEDPNRPPTSEELLNAYGFNRGFMTANGQPDNPRSARYILKDFVNGKLLFSHAPPTVQQNEYHFYPEKVRTNRILPPREQRAIKSIRTTGEDLDKMFFKENSKGFHAKGVVGKATGLPPQNEDGSVSGSMQALAIEKPWKKANKHINKKKREKLRRVYAHLDQH